jgi:hypothetical protein
VLSKLPERAWRVTIAVLGAIVFTIGLTALLNGA